MSILKHAQATWHGGMKDGGGTISTQTGVLKEAPYGFNARFENGPGTNPEELIAAAHAGCFTMALAGMLAAAGHKAETLETKAVVALDKVGDGYEISSSTLTLSATVPGIEQAAFDDIAAKAKAGCPISKLLNAKIELTATLNK